MSELASVEAIDARGAKRSTHLLSFDQDGRESVLVEAATVSASATRVGLLRQASPLSLPEETA